MKYQRMLYKRDSNGLRRRGTEEVWKEGEEGKVRVWVVLLARRDGVGRGSRGGGR